jgi:hypothetical protein
MQDLMNEEAHLFPLDLFCDRLSLPETADILIVKLKRASQIGVERGWAIGVVSKELGHLFRLFDRVWGLGLKGYAVLDGANILSLVSSPSRFWRSTGVFQSIDFCSLVVFNSKRDGPLAPLIRVSKL